MEQQQQQQQQQRQQQQRQQQQQQQQQPFESEDVSPIKNSIAILVFWEWNQQKKNGNFSPSTVPSGTFCHFSTAPLDLTRNPS